MKTKGGALVAIMTLLLVLPPFVYADYTIDITAATGERCWPSVDNTDYRCGQQFTTVGAGDVSSVTMKMAKHNSPTQLLTAKIETTSGGSPTGTVLGTSSTFDASTIGASACSSGGNSVTFTFATPVSLSASTEYAVTVTGSANNGTNYPAICGKNPGDTSGSDVIYGTNTTWTVTAPSALYLTVPVVESSGGGGGDTSATSTWTATTTFSCVLTSTSSLCDTSNSGIADIIFMLGWLVFFAAINFMGMIWNAIAPRKYE